MDLQHLNSEITSNIVNIFHIQLLQPYNCVSHTYYWTQARASWTPYFLKLKFKERRHEIKTGFPKHASILVQIHILTFQCNWEKGPKNTEYSLSPLQQSTLNNHQWRKRIRTKKICWRKKCCQIPYTWFSISYIIQVYREYAPVKACIFLIKEVKL